MLVTTQCASYCRYCTRSRIVGDPRQTFSRQEFEMQIEYLKRTPQVRDVLLSGGDPLVLAPKILEEILNACVKSRISRSSASVLAYRFSCPCASRRNCATCWRSTTRCG
jgi:molybdenum cofactor biosynthesis enzyme MoaA